MNEMTPSVAEQVGGAAVASQIAGTGNAPSEATVVLSEATHPQ